MNGMAKQNMKSGVEPIDTPSSWFNLLERALRDGDRKQEAIARRELVRLGFAIWVDEEKFGFRAAAAGGGR